MVVSPSAECRATAGDFAPVVHRSKCEGKAECVEVCPVHVFEVRRMEDADFASLGVLAKLKSVAHGRKTAYTPRASACEACGKCVAACPEKAIKLVRIGSSVGPGIGPQRRR
jgi:NAD-dependent dihydropyrimidine dehydrogenase PreA subunit